MDLTFTADELAFRDDVRRFIRENYPDDLRDKVARDAEIGREDYLRWHRILYQQGWIAPGWPKEYGGTGWNPVQRYFFQEELAAADTLRIVPFGVGMVGPVIYTFATPEQKQRFLPRILSGEDWWCQGYSEPGAGSDLASLRTRAVRDGDRYIVNGGKTWTTYAHFADWMFCLVRTDPDAKKQEGISFLLIDMKTPGITVRPIITIDGAHDVNEVFLEDVVVPTENLIGEENKGWTYAKFLLGHERTGIAGVARAKAQLARLKRIAGVERRGGAPLAEDADFTRKIAQTEIELMALEITELRTLASESAGRGPGPEASLLKVRGTEIQQRISELLLEAIGPYALPRIGAEARANLRVGPDHAVGIAGDYFGLRKISIYGGTNEIQRNIMAKMILGL
jgi:alkylation response protein AidB-like acyl-CoA dehydrogenase